MTRSGDHGPSFVVLLTLCCLVTFGCYFAVSIRLPLVPLYARSFGVTTAQIGVINAAFYLMAGLLALPSGALSDRFGRKRMAVTGSLILLAGMLLLSIGRSYPMLTLIYLLLGAGLAAFGPTMMSWVAEIAPSTHLGRAYGWYTTALFCAMGAGPAVGGAAGKYLGYPPVFLIGALVVAVNLWAVWRLLPATEPDASGGGGRGRWRRSLNEVLGNRPLLGCWAAAFGACIVTGMFLSFLPLHADNRGLGVGQIGAVFLVQAAANGVSRIPFGAFSDRVGQRKHQALAGVLLITLSIAAFAPARSFHHFLVAGIALGASNAVAFTSVGALIAETVAPRIRGMAMGGYNTAIYFGLMAGSILLGPVIEAIGFGPGFLLTGVLNLPFVLCFAWAMRGYRRELPEGV
ncbi:MAG: MFS transporter [Desulfobacteraceae bacterium]|nr:MFS transporter [Desulfobacteraceae bacterium]